MKNCKQCGDNIPHNIKVDGVWRRTGSRNYCLKCSPYKAGNTKQLRSYRLIDGIETKFCIRCQDWKQLKEFSRSRYGYYNSWCKICDRKRHTDRKLEAIQIKGNKCFDCQQSFAPYIYDFHHVDPTKKDLIISMQSSREVFLTELEKCVLLCSHCHRNRHYNPQNPNYCPLR